MFNKEELDRIIKKISDGKAEREKEKIEENKEQDEKARKEIDASRQKMREAWTGFVNKYKTELANIVELSMRLQKIIDYSLKWNFNYERDDDFKLNIIHVSEKSFRKWGKNFKVRIAETRAGDGNALEMKLNIALEISDSLAEGDYFMVRDDFNTILFPLENTEENLILFKDGIFHTLGTKMDTHAKNLQTEATMCGILAKFISKLPCVFEDYKQSLDDAVREEEKNFEKEEARRKKLNEKKKKAKRMEDELKTQNEILQMENAQELLIKDN